MNANVDTVRSAYNLSCIAFPCHGATLRGLVPSELRTLGDRPWDAAAMKQCLHLALLLPTATACRVDDVGNVSSFRCTFLLTRLLAAAGARENQTMMSCA